MLNYSNFSNKPKFYFIGIGGISMSALAKFIKSLDFVVGGSDKVCNEVTKELQEQGIEINYNHNGENIIGYDVIIYNSAIGCDNEEFNAAIELNKIILKRAELLQIIANDCKVKIGVCGCHGKTTATSIIAHAIGQSQYKMFAHIGGIDKDFQNLYYSGNDVFLSEICEYDKNIDCFDMDIAICLNIDVDHNNSYDGFSDLIHSYYKFLNRAVYRIVNIDDDYLKAYDNSKITISKIDEEADYFAKNISLENGELCFECYEKGVFITEVKLNICGEHNVYNALCAIALARIINIDIKSAKKGIGEFHSIKRRNEFLGYKDGNVFIADYCHHPKEIEATLNAYCKKKNIVVIFQPHTYSRTKFLFDDFINVLSTIDNLIIYKTFAARENPCDGTDAYELSKNVNNSLYIDCVDDLTKYLRAFKGRTILVLGAGDIYDIVRQYVNNDN